MRTAQDRPQSANTPSMPVHGSVGAREHAMDCTHFYILGKQIRCRKIFSEFQTANLEASVWTFLFLKRSVMSWRWESVFRALIQLSDKLSLSE